MDTYFTLTRYQGVTPGHIIYRDTSPVLFVGVFGPDVGVPRSCLPWEKRVPVPTVPPEEFQWPQSRWCRSPLPHVLFDTYLWVPFRPTLLLCLWTYFSHHTLHSILLTPHSSLPVCRVGYGT